MDSNAHELPRFELHGGGRTPTIIHYIYSGKKCTYSFSGLQYAIIHHDIQFKVLYNGSYYTLLVFARGTKKRREKTPTRPITLFP
jgi:hypothetical protein